MIMDGSLSSSAWLLSVLGPWGPVKDGWLKLSNGVLAFEQDGTRDPLFSVPVEEVQARFPRLYFGLGLQLITHGKKHRVWFVPIRWIPFGSADSGGGRGFYLKEIGPARSATQTWRTALSGPGT
jgi:hypothetical protein